MPLDSWSAPEVWRPPVSEGARNPPHFCKWRSRRLYYIAGPFIRLARRMPLSVLTPPVTYFCGIGIGFMLIEISQMQRLMVFLGHPVYGLSVVLFTILLFSGLGSTTVGAQAPRPGAAVAGWPHSCPRWWRRDC